MSWTVVLETTTSRPLRELTSCWVVQATTRYKAATVADLLIGGLGADLLLAAGGEDILIGGTTAHDADYTALQTILSEWNSSESYATRVINISGGYTGPLLNTSTVFDDGSVDGLRGEGRPGLVLRQAGARPHRPGTRRDPDADLAVPGQPRGDASHDRIGMNSGVAIVFTKSDSAIVASELFESGSFSGRPGQWSAGVWTVSGDGVTLAALQAGTNAGIPVRRRVPGSAVPC